MALPPTARVRWQRHDRVVPSRYPPVDLFERIADPADWETVAAIESMTNDRLRDEIGDISLVPPDERIAGPGASPIMAAFTHIGHASRFSDGSYGVYYAGDRLEAAIAEVAYHQARFLARTGEPKTRLELRNYRGSIDAELHDVRGKRRDVHAPNSYAAGQRLGRAVRAAGGNGIVYDSVRWKGAANIAVLRPKALAARGRRAHVVQGAHLFMLWDGERMTHHLIAGETEWKVL